jgi:hypothetical protein
VWSIFELGLPASTVMTDLVIDHAIGKFVSTVDFAGVTAAQVVVHAVMPACVGWRAIGAIMVFDGLVCHPAGRKGEIQPDSNEQAESPETPGFAQVRGAAGETQMIISRRFSDRRKILVSRLWRQRVCVKDRHHGQV